MRLQDMPLEEALAKLEDFDTLARIAEFVGRGEAPHVEVTRFDGEHFYRFVTGEEDEHVIGECSSNLEYAARTFRERLDTEEWWLL